MVVTAEKDKEEHKKHVPPHQQSHQSKNKKKKKKEKKKTRTQPEGLTNSFWQLKEKNPLEKHSE